MRALIGQKLIDKLKPEDKPYEVRDTRLKGFLVRVQPSGAMSYIVEWGRGKRMTLRGTTGALKPTKARELARAHLGTVAKGEDPRTVKRNEKIPTYKNFVEQAFKPWAAAHHRNPKESLRKLESFFEDIGGKKLNEITPWHIEKRRSARLKAGIKASSENRDLDSLKGALNKAVEWRQIEVNPLAGLKRLKTDTAARIRYLEPDEEARLRDALEAREEKRRKERAGHNQWRRERGYQPLPEFGTFTDHLKPLVLLDLNTGLRRGELFNLHWTDIDLQRAMLTVVGSGAKSQKTRHIPLNREALEVLQAWREQAADASGRVFRGREGGRFNNVKRSWEKILKDANIAGFRFHDLRHDFASKLVMSGVDLNTVRELLGHSDIKMTLRYAHLAPEHKAAAVERLMDGRKTGAVSTVTRSA